MNHCTKCTTLGSCPMTQSGSCKFQTPKLQNQQPKITFRNIKQRWLLYSGSSRKNWATFQSMTRACLMCGQTFRYVAFCYVFWQRQAEQHALQNLSNADSSLCLVSHPCYLFAACIRVQNKRNCMSQPLLVSLPL